MVLTYDDSNQTLKQVSKIKGIKSLTQVINFFTVQLYNCTALLPGDCTAVIGSLSETGTWIAKKLTTEHNSDNVQEVG